MRMRSFLVALVVTVILGAVAYARWQAKPRQGHAAARSGDQDRLVVTTSAKRQNLELAVTQTGVIAAKNATPVVPEISGRIQFICGNGIVVSAGDVILRLDPTQLQEQATDLTVRYNEAQMGQSSSQNTGMSRMKEMRLRLQRAQSDVTSFGRQQEVTLRQLRDSIAFDENELKAQAQDVERTRRLAAKGLVAGTEVERAEAAFKSAEFALGNKKSDYELKQSQAESDTIDKRRTVNNTTRDMSRTRTWTERETRMSGNQLDTLKLQLDRANADLQKTVIVAPVGGLVVLAAQGGWMGNANFPKMGDFVSQGREIASIVGLGKMQVRVELDQTQIAGMKMGQAAEVGIEALPGQVLTGRISAIGQNARRPPIQGWMGLSQTATFPVTIELPPTGTALIRPGMRANVRIVYRTVKNATVVPTSCIFRRDGKSIVFVQRGGRFTQAFVTEGESNGDYTAITRGLRAGEHIALNDLGTPTPAEETKAKEKRR